MDLSLIRYRYDALFSDIVATGERAHAANEEQISETEVHLDKEKLNDFDKEHFINLNNEESHDPNDMNSPMFFKPSLKREFSTDDIGTSNRVKKSKTKSAREELHSLVELMPSKSADTSHAVEDPTIDKCMEFLESWPEIDIPSETYNYDEDDEELQKVHQEQDEEWMTLCQLAGKYVLTYCEKYLCKEPCRISKRSGHIFIQEMLRGNEIRCYENFRLKKAVFIDLSNDLAEKYGLKATREISTHEMLGTFLMDCIGALDDTHVKARLPQGQEISYIDLKVIRLKIFLTL
ncbi:hypothetical protein FXO38_10660 [Capsicum annuum]|nr:hypothetical protein FXO38_10660 [Capsicum annuum]KAF3674471.1 hypothetical protein FXO37_06386 [Capsicum annuum]